MSDSDSQVYSRIYHRLMNEYPSIWRNDSALALYIRLLITADKFWPERPPVPLVVHRRRSSFNALVKVGLIQSEPDMTYSVRGLNAERTARSNAARTAARARHAMPSKEEKRKEEKGHIGQHENCLVCEPLRRPQVIEGGKGA